MPTSLPNPRKLCKSWTSMWAPIYGHMPRSNLKNKVLHIKNILYIHRNHCFESGSEVEMHNLLHFIRTMQWQFLAWTKNIQQCGSTMKYIIVTKSQWIQPLTFLSTLISYFSTILHQKEKIFVSLPYLISVKQILQYVRNPTHNTLS